MFNLKKLHIVGGQLVAPALIGSGNLVASLIRGVFWLTIASVLTTEDYGQVNYYLAIGTMLSTISLFGLNSTIITFIAKGNENIFKQASLLALILSSIAAIAVAVILNNLPTAFLLLAASAFAMSVDEELGRKKYRKYSILTIVNSSSQFALGLGLYYIMGLNGIIIGYGIPSLILGYRLFFSLKNPSFSFNEIRPRINFTIDAYSLSLSQSISTYADKLVIVPLFGFTILGLYQLSSQFLIFLAIIPATLYRYLLPEQASGHERKAIRKVGLAAAVFFSTTSYFAIPYLVNWFFPKFAEAIPAAQIMIFGIIPLTVNSIINSRFLGRERSRPVLIGSVIYIATLMILLYVFGNMMGLIGLAISVIISLSLQSISLLIMDRYQNSKRQAPTTDPTSTDSKSQT